MFLLLVLLFPSSAAAPPSSCLLLPSTAFRRSGTTSNVFVTVSSLLRASFKLASKQYTLVHRLHVGPSASSKRPRSPLIPHSWHTRKSLFFKAICIFIFR